MAIHIEATNANSGADHGAIAGDPATSGEGLPMSMPGMSIFIPGISMSIDMPGSVLAAGEVSCMGIDIEAANQAT